MVFSRKTLISLASITGVVDFSSLIAINSAHAYSVNFNNGGFEDPINFNDTSFADGWEGAGDTSSLGTYSTVNPFDTTQAVITTACPGTSQTGECLNNRNDDTTTTLGQFNNSGNDQISASIDFPFRTSFCIILSNMF